MLKWLKQLDSILRGEATRLAALRQGIIDISVRGLSSVLVSLGVLYGLCMAVFSLVDSKGLRWQQLIASAVKVPLLLLATFLLGLPSFFVLNTLAGLREDFVAAVRALVATQAGLTIILAAFAPFTMVWYASNSDYSLAILFNAVMFGLASVAAQWLLRRFYAPLIRKNPRHRLLLRMWLVIYAFVGIQMGWVLRPFIGDPHAPTRFFRAGMWGNAYEQLAHIAQGALGL